MSNLELLTDIHTGLSFLALALGIPAIASLFKRALSRNWIALFLMSAWATTITGFFFPFIGFTPAFITGIVSAIVLIGTSVAQHGFHMKGRARDFYACGIVMSEYLLVFVAIAQTFLKIEFFNNLAPTLSEPPFAIAQVVGIAVFGIIGWNVIKTTPTA